MLTGTTTAFRDLQKHLPTGPEMRGLQRGEVHTGGTLCESMPFLQALQRASAISRVYSPQECWWENPTLYGLEY